MPASQRSLRVTNVYRERLAGIQARLARDVGVIWAAIDPGDLDNSYDATRAARLIEGAQGQAVHASAGYLAAFLSSEVGRRVTAAPADRVEAGSTAAGRPLADAASGVLLGVKANIASGRGLDAAMSLGRAELLRLAGAATDSAAREAITEGLVTDERFIGWRRAVRGTCGACLGAASGRLISAEQQIETHPGCQCVQEPEVAGVRQRFKRPSGAAIFATYSVARQDSLLGEEKAQLVRDGEIGIHDLVDYSPIKHGPNILTERPLDALKRRSATE